MGVLCLAAGLTLSLAASAADAFCGFYVAGSNEKLLNNATQVALMRDGTRTVMTMSNNYQGPPENFAMVVPVPIVLQKENVKTLPVNVFEHVEMLTAPRLVEYWEQDPCAPIVDHRAHTRRSPGGALRGGMVEDSPSNTHGVKIEAQFVVGEYEVLILSATESTGLETWLKENHYSIPDGAAESLAPYIRDQSKFFVAKVDITKVARKSDGSATLSPLRFHYDSPDFKLPVRLGLLNASDAQDLIVYILHKDKRFEVANYPNVTVPTNLDVLDSVRAQFPSFYAALFDRTVQQAGGRVVVTEYAWNTGSCDPCPTPPLEASDLATLGTDALPSPELINAYSMTVTRLHARYSRSSLNEDLVFRETTAIVGGREFVQGANGELEHGSRPAEYDSNNFQARYAIRHPWTGPIACAAPRRGTWGGPWEGQTAQAPAAARGLATAPRGAVDLPKSVYTAAPEIQLVPAVARGGGGVTVVDAGMVASADARVVAAEIGAAPQGSKPPAQPATLPTPASAAPVKKSCGCEVPGSPHSSKSALVIGILALFAVGARREKKQ